VKRVQLRKYRPRKRTTKYFYDVGRLENGKPEYSIQISRKLLDYDSYGAAWLTFPVKDACIVSTDAGYRMIPQRNHIVYDFYLIAGAGGSVAIDISADCDFEEVIIYSTVPMKKSVGGGRGVLVSLPKLLPLTVHWLRTGFGISGFFHEGTIRINVDGSIVRLT